jgi:hypothetical protein
MGLYAQLLVRYLRVPADTLFQSLQAAGIEADMQAKPVFSSTISRCDEHALGHLHPRFNAADGGRTKSIDIG